MVDQTYEWLELDDQGDPVTRRITRTEILQQYWPFWCDEMIRVGRAHLISEDHCVEDFLVVHWAYVAR